MELHDANPHRKLIEMCDCYMETDYLPQIKKLANSPGRDTSEDAVKYLALSIMYAIAEKANKLSFKKKQGDMTISLRGEEKSALPTPSPEVFEGIMNMMKDIIHMEGDKADMTLSLGLRNDSIDIRIKMERENGREKLKIQLPLL